MPAIATQSLLRNALTFHSAGKLEEAERLYLRALDEDSHDPDALHLFGVLRSDQGRAADAVRLIEQAITIRSDAARYHSDLGNVLCGLGRNSDAIGCHERAIELE